MKYVSIIRLFEYCNIDYLEFNLSKIKKVIAAEYSISDNGIISIGKFDYTKDSVLQEIERDDFAERLQHHHVIWEQKDLLNFLEHDYINDNASQWYYLNTNENFKQFVSPYFAYAFNKAMHKFLRSMFLIKASHLLTLMVFVNYADENDALQSTRAFISESLKLFKNTSKSNYRKNYAKLKIWAKQPVYLFINNLPASLSGETEDLVIALINFTVEIQFKDRRFCLDVSENLIRVSCVQQEHLKHIRDNHAIYKAKIGAGYYIRRYLKWAAIIIFGGRVLIYVLAFLIGLVSKCTGG